jgi:hypothetical protein
MKRQQKKDLSKTHLFDLKTSLEWCKAVLGILPSKEVPRVRRNNNLKFDYFQEDEEGFLNLMEEISYGAYDCLNNTIYINISAHFEVPAIARTFIHEYVHYLQDVCDEENETTWDPNFTMQEVCSEDGLLIEDCIIENEAEYNARLRYKDLLKHLGYDYTHS